MNDDNGQIVNNTLVHSISHIHLFFESGTFYGGVGNPLTGIYYRPLMTTVFSLLYTVFGPHSFYFHLLQLLLYILSAIILFLLFKYFFKPALALFLSLVFLVHPLNSQIVYAIPSMQDVLFFFFGILALYLLIRYSSVKSLLLVALCLLLCLLSKETGLVIIAMALIYLFWFDRQRLLAFTGIMALPVIFYLNLKLNAVGLNNSTGIAQIDSLSLWGRLLTVPSIILFYIIKFIFPYKLATGYYWTYPTFSVRHVLLPLLIDLVVLALLVVVGVELHKKHRDDQFWVFVFFGVWALIGLTMHLQIMPLDMTACEDWFFFTMAGLLGMAGVAIESLLPRLKPVWLPVVIGIVIIATLGVRSAIRGHDYSDEYKLAKKDITISKENYTAYYQISCDLSFQGKFSEAKSYALKSISLFPTAYNYYYLGYALTSLGDYNGAIEAYEKGVKYNISLNPLYDNLGNLLVVYGENKPANNQFFLDTIKKFPLDSTIWTDYAVFQSEHNDQAGAQKTTDAASLYNLIPAPIHKAIMDNQPLTITMSGLGKSIKIN